MTFTTFLTNPKRKDAKPTFLPLIRDRLWPRESSRLDDFESFLATRLDEHLELVIPELRILWREFAEENPEGKHDLDLAVAAWGDYASHLRTCTGTEMSPCEVAAQLLEAAVEVSAFEDTPRPLAHLSPCGVSSDDEEDLDDDAGEDFDGDDEDEVTELF